VQGVQFILNRHQQWTYYRLKNLVHNSLPLWIGFKRGVLFSCGMVHLYRNMSDLRFWYWHAISAV